MSTMNGTNYNDKTPGEVVRVLENARLGGLRVRVFYGDFDTGKDWGEESDIIGRIGRSCGRSKIPLMINSERSMGGPAVLDDCIVKIMSTMGRVLYQHPTYNQPVYTIGEPGEICKGMPEYKAGAYADGENVANFANKRQAEKYVDFMTGKRFTKGGV